MCVRMRVCACGEVSFRPLGPQDHSPLQVSLCPPAAPRARTPAGRGRGCCVTHASCLASRHQPHPVVCRGCGHARGRAAGAVARRTVAPRGSCDVDVARAPLPRAVAARSWHISMWTDVQRRARGPDCRPAVRQRVPARAACLRVPGLPQPNPRPASRVGEAAASPWPRLDSLGSWHPITTQRARSHTGAPPADGARALSNARPGDFCVPKEGSEFRACSSLRPCDEGGGGPHPQPASQPLCVCPAPHPHTTATSARLPAGAWLILVLFLSLALFSAGSAALTQPSCRPPPCAGCWLSARARAHAP